MVLNNKTQPIPINYARNNYGYSDFNNNTNKYSGHSKYLDFKDASQLKNQYLQLLNQIFVSNPDSPK